MAVVVVDDPVQRFRMNWNRSRSLRNYGIGKDDYSDDLYQLCLADKCDARPTTVPILTKSWMPCVTPPADEPWTRSNETGCAREVLRLLASGD